MLLETTCTVNAVYLAALEYRVIDFVNHVPVCNKLNVKLKKSEIVDQHLSEYVIMPDGITMSFSKWWKSLEETTEVEVRFPYERHGNAGKTSNYAKSDVKEKFLLFVDNSSQSNGRSEDSTGPTLYFSPKFTTIQTPKPGSALILKNILEGLLWVSLIVFRENKGRKSAVMGLPTTG